MKINIERPTQTTFGKLRTGQVFESQGNVFIKGEGNTAISIHKAAGHMNAGQSQAYAEDAIVQYVTEITFKVG